MTTSTPTALITGGTSGIGLATAALLHDRGYRVAVTGASTAGIERARAELPEVLAIRADAASLDETTGAVATAAEHFGPLTALFLNAGITRQTPIGAVDEAAWDEVFDINAKSAFFTLQAALPQLADGASVVVTVGIGATPPYGIAGGSVTAASRGALLTMVPSLALELAPRGIRINAVSPGAIDTPIWQKSGAPAATIDVMKQQIAARTPLGRLGEAREIAETVAFLLGGGASYVTGQNIVVGGGAGLRA